MSCVPWLRLPIIVVLIYAMDIGGLSVQGQRVLTAIRKMHLEKSHAVVQKNVIVFSQQLPDLSAQENGPRVQHGEEQIKDMSCFLNGSEAEIPSFHYDTHDDINRSCNLDNPLEITFANDNDVLPIQSIKGSETDVMVLPFPGSTSEKFAFKSQKLNRNVFHTREHEKKENKEKNAVFHVTEYKENKNEEKPIESLNNQNNSFLQRSVLDHSQDINSNAAIACNSLAVQCTFPSVFSSSGVDNNDKEIHGYRDTSKLKQFNASIMPINLAKRQNTAALLTRTVSLEKHEVNSANLQDYNIDKTTRASRTEKEKLKDKCNNQKCIKDFFRVRKMFGTSAMEHSLEELNLTKRLCKEKTFSKPSSLSVATLLSDALPITLENIEGPSTEYSGNENIKNVYKNTNATFNIQCNPPKIANDFSREYVPKNSNVDNTAETAANNPGFRKINTTEKILMFNSEENSYTEGTLKEINSDLTQELVKNSSEENESSCSPIIVHAQKNGEASNVSRKSKSTASESLNGRGKKNKKCVFQVPLKKYFKENKEMTEDKLNDTVINDLNESVINSILLQLDTKGLMEIGFTILYREGFCQLNKPKELSKHAHCTPKALMLSITQNNSNATDFYYFTIDEQHWPDKTIPRKFLMKILSGRCRKVCFGAQEMVVLLMDIFGFEKQDVLKWVLLDPMVGCWLLNPGQSSYHFIDMCEKFDTEKKPARKSQTSKIQACHFLQMLSVLTEKLYIKLQEQKLWKLFLETEMKVVPIIAAMEFRGICVDKEELKKINTLLQEEIFLLQQKAFKAAGRVFQLNSLQQLTKILFEELQLEKKANIKVKETLTRGTKSTSEPVLRKLQPFHALPGIILEYRHLQKIKSTYVEAILQHCKGSYIFTSWEQTSAATGRLTSSNPNLQAIPKQLILLTKQRSLLLRTMYVPRSGYTFLAVDFQHIEFRIFAQLAHDEKLIQILQQPGDIFMTLAKLWLGKTEETATLEDREKTKRIIYAVMYGAGALKVAEFLHLSTTDASSIINNFVSAFPVLNKFRNQVLAECRTQGFLRTIGGRLRMFPNISSDNSMSRAYAERQAMNFIIQGSAADMCKVAMIHTEQKLQDEPAHLLLQIHDELVWEVLDSHLMKTIDIVKSTLNNLPAFCGLKPVVPFPIVVSTGKTWGEMKI